MPHTGRVANSLRETEADSDDRFPEESVMRGPAIDLGDGKQNQRIL